MTLGTWNKTNDKGVLSALFRRNTHVDEQLRSILSNVEDKISRKKLYSYIH